MLTSYLMTSHRIMNNFNVFGNVTTKVEAFILKSNFT